MVLSKYFELLAAGVVGADTKIRFDTSDPQTAFRKALTMSHLEIYYPTGRDVPAWEQAHAAGDVPDRWPYGLHKLGRSSELRVKSVEAKALRPLGLAKTLASRSVPAAETKPTSIAWDEDLALRLITERPKHQKFAGVIWATDRIAAKQTGPKDLLLKALLPRMNGLWALSQPQTELIRDWLGKDAPPVHFLRFGIDHHFFTPCEYPDRPLVLSIGRDRDRDPKTLFAVAEEVLRSRPDAEVVIQSGSSLRPPAGVQVIPSIPHRQLRDYYRRASVVAVATRPNVHVSGMTVALESMATGRPVVMSDTPGMRDYVDNGVTGLLFPCGDSSGMAEGIISLLDSPKVAAQMGQMGTERIRALHTTDLMAESLRQIVRL